MKKEDINYLKKRINLYDTFFQIYKLLNWIDINKLNFRFLSENPYAINLIEKNLNKIQLKWLCKNINANCFFEEIIDSYSTNYDSDKPDKYYMFDHDYYMQLSRNQSAIYSLEKKKHKIFWCKLSSNPNAIHLLEQNKDKINWCELSANPNAIHLLEKNHNEIDWGILSINPNAIHLLEQNQDEIYWYNLSSNPNAIHLLEKNQDKISWYALSSNPNAIHILELNQDKINWDELSKNPNAIKLLEQNQEKINWDNLSSNINIFEIDYNFLQNRMKNTIVEELIKNRFNPKNMDKWTTWGF